MARILILILTVFTLALTGCSKQPVKVKATDNIIGLTIRSFDGAPYPAQKKFEESLTALAPQYGFKLSQTDQSKLHLKLFFSDEPSDMTRVNIYYVVDVYDNNNHRLHRLNGSMEFMLKASSAWNNVSLQAYDSIAGDILKKLQKWQSAQQN